MMLESRWSFPVTIRPMMPSDLQQVVEVHLGSFEGFFLTFLGARFIRLLYRNIQEDSKGIFFVAESQGRIEGFVAGVVKQGGFYQRMVKKRKWAFGVAALGALIRRPAIAGRLIRALKKPLESKHASAEACLMSIAVRPGSKGRDIGRSLVQAFCRELADRGASAVCLTTDKDKNDVVNRFYEKLGFRLVRSYLTPEGRGMNEYYLSLRGDHKGNDAAHLS